MNVNEIENIQVNPNTVKYWIPNNQKFVYKIYLKERKCIPFYYLWSKLIINWDVGVSPRYIVDDEKSDFKDIFKKVIKKMEQWILYICIINKKIVLNLPYLIYVKTIHIIQIYLELAVHLPLQVKKIFKC